MTDKIAVKMVVMQQGLVDFATIPTSALNEVADKHFGIVDDRKILVDRLSDRLLQADGIALLDVLHDLREAAVRYGETESVLLTHR